MYGYCAVRSVAGPAEFGRAGAPELGEASAPQAEVQQFCFVRITSEFSRPSAVRLAPSAPYYRRLEFLAEPRPSARLRFRGRVARSAAPPAPAPVDRPSRTGRSAACRRRPAQVPVFRRWLTCSESV